MVSKKSFLELCCYSDFPYGRCFVVDFHLRWWVESERVCKRTCDSCLSVASIACLPCGQAVRNFEKRESFWTFRTSSWTSLLQDVSTRPLFYSLWKFDFPTKTLSYNRRYQHKLELFSVFLGNDMFVFLLCDGCIIVQRRWVNVWCEEIEICWYLL